MEAIDLFAGAGGFSTGAKLAGVKVVWAANHWPQAVAIHAANHPAVDHVCQDLHQADWSQVPAHDLLLASPACQGHSKARGKDKPVHDVARSTAWAVVSAAEYHRPYTCVIENVTDFMTWQLYPAWQSAMESLGYTLSPHIIDAADHGVPQNRERLFIIATKSLAPLKLKLPKRPHQPVNNVIQWDAFRWSAVNKKGRSPKTLARVTRGRAAFGERFVMPYYGSGSGLTGRSLDRPLGTVTTRDRWAVVNGSMMRMLQPPEYRDIMVFPKDYVLPQKRTLAIHLLGNAVCPQVAADVVQAIQKAA